MKSEELQFILEKLRNLPAESEVFEFKEAKNQYDFNKIGKYFSALSNEANLKNKIMAWLIFGIRDSDREIVGTTYRLNKADLDNLKGEIARKTNNSITFVEIYELILNQKRVLMFQIPPAMKGIPTSWEGHWYARNGQELVSLSIEKLERIRSQNEKYDWSAKIISAANINDLDPEAVLKARENYFKKFPDKIEEGKNWDDKTFLNKAKITIQSNITTAAIILLGKEDSEHFIDPSVAKIRWILKDRDGNEKDYQIFGPPLLLSIEKVYKKIRNLKYRYIKDGTLFPEEALQYEPYVIREALNNCIAHQDYSYNSRINVIEMEDQLIFSNRGSFIPGSIENVIMNDAPEERYRNAFLANAMFNLNMVDTIGSGIRKMYNYQKERFFPLPEYEITNDRIIVTITGKVIDLDYARTLAKNPTLTLEEIIMLDKVQKHKKLLPHEIKLLKSKKLIEGRSPNFFVAKSIAEVTKEKAKYIRNIAFDNDHYKSLVIALIKKYGQATRQEIDELLLEKLSDVLSPEQKRNKIRNLLYSMHKKDKTIDYFGSGSKSIWKLLSKR